MSEWRELGAIPLAEGEMRELAVEGGRVVVARAAGRVRAFQPLCPHASAPLVEGDLRPTYVICPLHAYRFDLARGTCLKPRDGPRLRLYPIEERADGLWLLI